MLIVSANRSRNPSFSELDLRFLGLMDRAVDPRDAH
jgi:hypothetical protein